MICFSIIFLSNLLRKSSWQDRGPNRHRAARFMRLNGDKGLAAVDSARRTGNLSHSGDAFELESSGSPTGGLTTKNTVFSSRILLWKQVRKQVGRLLILCAAAGWIDDPNCAVYRRWTHRGA